jgi:hypothetical protein
VGGESERVAVGEPADVPPPHAATARNRVSQGTAAPATLTLVGVASETVVLLRCGVQDAIADLLEKSTWNPTSLVPHSRRGDRAGTEIVDLVQP